jgi:hypothetical protein
MKQIRYNSTAAPLRLAIPAEWDVTLLTALTLTVTDLDGVELLAADAATLWADTTLAADADAYLSSLTLAAGATDLAKGDPIQIQGVVGPERHIVKGYDSTTKIVEIEQILENDHVTGDEVWGLFADYELDTSTVATWTAGLVFTLTWTPTGTGTPITEMGQIAKSALDLQGLERRFSILYPRAHDDFSRPSDKFAEVLEEAELQVENDLLGAGVLMQRVVDQDKLSPLVMKKLACMWTWNGDKNKEDERNFLCSDYDKELAKVLSWPIWVDQDQDKVQDEDEVTSHNPIFCRSW